MSEHEYDDNGDDNCLVLDRVFHHVYIRKGTCEELPKGSGFHATKALPSCIVGIVVGKRLRTRSHQSGVKQLVRLLT